MSTSPSGSILFSQAYSVQLLWWLFFLVQLRCSTWSFSVGFASLLVCWVHNCIIFCRQMAPSCTFEGVPNCKGLFFFFFFWQAELCMRIRSYCNMKLLSSCTHAISCSGFVFLFMSPQCAVILWNHDSTWIYFLTKWISRGNIALDGSSWNTAVSPPALFLLLQQMVS